MHPLQLTEASIQSYMCDTYAVFQKTIIHGLGISDKLLIFFFTSQRSGFNANSKLKVQKCSSKM